jgi:hypothetical protein
MPTWVEAYNMTRAAMARSNGTFGDAQIPRVTNQEAASLLRFAMRVATTHKMDPELYGSWYALALALAGWRQPGDKFLVDEKHRKGKFPDQYTAELWQLVLNVAIEAQGRSLPFSAPTMDPPADYKLILTKAWDKMRADQPAAAAAVKPPPPPVSSPATSPASVPDESDTDGGSSGLILLLILFAVGNGKV